MTLEMVIKHSQVYRFLADAFLYPQESWVEDLPAVNEILAGMGLQCFDFPMGNWELARLQELHLQTFGLTGSLCYETEYGLPHEFRQSQELADIAGFYLAFGFQTGGVLRERPDHLAVELEFMHLLCLKEALAISQARQEDIQVCQDAQRSFLKDHLASWIGLFSQSMELSIKKTQIGSEEVHPYRSLSAITNLFVKSHAESLGAQPVLQKLSNIQPTPLGPEMSCGDCPLSDSLANEETCL